MANTTKPNGAGAVTPGKHRGLMPAWKPGESGNPAGRPKGARSKLGEQFLDDVLTAWERDGQAAIKRMVSDRPGDFVKVVASILPREIFAAGFDKRSELDWTRDELLAFLNGVTGRSPQTPE